ncbi:hypothetical protein [Kitasatospora sp. HPMI-4]|uniref:hypothetical protein n=1 Tax=Kitasatospora sp. HPMI-4 TaxID=3448443 RepID=UPI003F1CC11B
MSSRLPRTAVLLLALPLLLAGCASGATGSHPDGDARSSGQAGARTTATPPPLVSTPPVLDSANDRPLPLDGYLLNRDQQTTVEVAQQKLIVSCMARLGFTYVPPAGPRPPRDSDAPTTRMDSRYGHQNAELMAKWGYHPEGGNPAGTGVKPSSQPMSQQMTTAMEGTSDPNERFGSGGQVFNGRQVPDHGCIGAADKQLTGAVDGLVGDAQVATDLKFETLKDSQHDERTQAVFAQWSHCMKDAGFDYPDPLAAVGDPQWRKTPTATPSELRVATADAACRHKFNVVGVWYAVDVAYQQGAIAGHAEAMAKAKTDLEALTKAATQAMAD